MNAPLLESMTMSEEEFRFFRQKIFELAGISMTEGKLELLQSRLRVRVTKLGLTGFKEYKKFLQQLGPDHEEWIYFVNQLTTNKTDWFREEEHFHFLINDFLPAWKKLGKSHLSVWCAASSTGEEPYTLAMVLHRNLRSSGITFEVLATDIDTKVLSFADNGVYPKTGLGLVPREYHDSFIIGSGEIDGWMKVRKEIKEKVKFRQLNLVNPDVSQVNFDIIFCRNVLIYFSPETIEKVIDGLFERAAKDSLLVISHSESLQNVSTKWKYVRPTIYQKGRLLIS